MTEPPGPRRGDNAAAGDSWRAVRRSRPWGGSAGSAHRGEVGDSWRGVSAFATDSPTVATPCGPHNKVAMTGPLWGPVRGLPGGRPSHPPSREGDVYPRTRPHDHWFRVTLGGMTGPEHSPWKPPQVGGQTPHFGAPPPQGQPPPPRARPGPWRAQDHVRQGSSTEQTEPPRTNLLNAISLVLAPIGTGLSLLIEIFPLGWMLLAVALVLGVIALFTPGRKRGVAVAGLIASWLGVVVAVVASLVYVFVMVFGIYQLTS